MMKKMNEKLTIHIPCSIIKEALSKGEKTLNISLHLELENFKDEQFDSTDNSLGVYDHEISGVAALSLRFA